jgi:apolipoprotein N-acyltransferase
LLQYADITGVWGISAWVVMCNVWLCQLVSAPKWRLWPAVLVGIALLWGLPGVYVLWVFQKSFDGDHPLQMAWLQPGASQLAPPALFEKSRQAIESFHPDLLLWPESLAREKPFHSIAHDPLARLLVQHDTALLAAYIDERYPQGLDGGALQTNRALLATAADLQPLLSNPKATEIGWLAELDRLPIQIKRRLVPHEEQRVVPDWLAQWLWHHHKRWLSHLTPGTAITPLPLTDTQRLGVLLCYEAYFPIEAALRVQAGATVLVVLANELAFGSSIAAWQAMTFVRLRAIENRRFVVRASAGAHSAWIDPFGRVVAQAPASVAAGAWPVPMLTHGTFFSRFPYGFVALCAAISLIFLWPLGKTEVRSGSTQ